jgi:uncharacterized protein (UPF0333 family)
MNYTLLFLVILLLVIIAYMYVSNSKLKNKHSKNMEALEEIIISLHTKQQLLNNKLTISNDYNENYRKDMKSLGDEVVELQKVFIEIISNRNYN